MRDRAPLQRPFPRTGVVERCIMFPSFVGYPRRAATMPRRAFPDPRVYNSMVTDNSHRSPNVQQIARKVAKIDDLTTKCGRFPPPARGRRAAQFSRPGVLRAERRAGRAEVSSKRVFWPLYAWEPRTPAAPGARRPYATCSARVSRMALAMPSGDRPRSSTSRSDLPWGTNTSGTPSIRTGESRPISAK